MDKRQAYIQNKCCDIVHKNKQKAARKLVVDRMHVRITDLGARSSR